MALVDGTGPQPAAIFLDINMPGMNGWGLAEYEQQLPGRECLIVMMLGSAILPGDQLRAEAIPLVNTCLPKPLTAEDLLGLRAEITH